MKINTQATNMELTPAISDYLSKKLTAIEKFIDLGDDSAVCNIEVAKTTNHHRSGDFFRAEINLEWSGEQYYSAVEKDDLYAAIDEMKDQIVAELSRSKDKHDTLLRDGGKEAKEILHEQPSEEELDTLI
jgi:ribosomal subunit interface protein